MNKDKKCVSQFCPGLVRNRKHRYCGECRNIRIRNGKPADVPACRWCKWTDDPEPSKPPRLREWELTCQKDEACSCGHPINDHSNDPVSGAIRCPYARDHRFLCESEYA